MINLRQIAVLVGTAAAVAGVLVLPDQAVSDDAAQVGFRDEMLQAASEKNTPKRELASEDQPGSPASPVFSPARPEDARARMLAAGEEYRDATKRLNALRGTQSIPVSAEVTTITPEFTRYSDLTFAPEASFSRVDGTGVSNSSTARLLSNMNLGVDLTWRQHWSEKFSTRLELGFSRVDFQGAPNSKIIDQKGKTFGRLGVGANYHLDDRWEAGAGLGIRQEAFYVATGATAIRVDQVPVTRAEASVRYDVVKLEPFRFGLGARSAYLFPTSADGYAVESGSSHRVSLYVKEEDADGRFVPTGEVFYDWKKQDTNLNRKTETELGLRLGFTWKFKP